MSGVQNSPKKSKSFLLRFKVTAIFFRFEMFFNVRFNIFFFLMLTSACSSKKGEMNDEQIRIQDSASETDKADSMTSNSIRGNLSLNQISTEPNGVVLTGLLQHRLVTVYKSKNERKEKERYAKTYYDNYDSEREEHFMPGIDLIYGYNLLNIAHYDLTTKKLNYLFEHPVLIKSLYYPSFRQDSLYKQPINRDYYLTSVYDADTNMDTLINKKDLRRFYYFSESTSKKTQLVPPDYSVIRSQYDPRNDVMFVFARQDTNNNGAIDKKEPLHIFWFSLKAPDKAARLY